MAGIKFRATTQEVSLTAATAKTVAQLVAATNHRALVRALEVMFKGTASGDTPVKIELVRQSTAGTGTAVTTAANGFCKDDPTVNETLQTAFNKDFSAEPTTSEMLKVWEIHPQTGVIYPLAFDWPVQVPGDSGNNLHRLALKMTAAQAQTVVVNIDGEE